MLDTRLFSRWGFRALLPKNWHDFLLAWSANHTHGQDRLRIVLTQEEIGEVIGVSRETVTRLLTAFKKNLLTVKGVTVIICNRAALQSLAGT